MWYVISFYNYIMFYFLLLFFLVSGALKIAKYVVAPIRLSRFPRAASLLFSLQTENIVCWVCYIH